MEIVTYHISKKHKLYKWLVCEIFYIELVRLNKLNKIKYKVKDYGKR
jgi:hypothetical protein